MFAPFDMRVWGISSEQILRFQTLQGSLAEYTCVLNNSADGISKGELSFCSRFKSLSIGYNRQYLFYNSLMLVFQM